MKLRLFTTVVFRCSPQPAANGSRRLRRTLSVITKTLSPNTNKPAAPAGFHFLIRTNFFLTGPFLSVLSVSLNSPSSNSIIQTPSTT
jgi:hypothetical protein